MESEKVLSYASESRILQNLDPCSLPKSTQNHPKTSHSASPITQICAKNLHI